MRVKRPIKKSSNAPTVGVVIREILVKSLSKKKEKMTVEKRKGIDLLSKMVLTEEAQYEEVRKKSLRDFHKTHPSGSSTVIKTAPSAAKIKPSVTNEGTGVKPGVPDVTKEESTEKDDEFVKIPSNDTDDEDEIKIKDIDEGDEDEGMDYTTNQFDDDVDLRMNEPVTTNEGLIQKEGIDAEMINVQQGNENLDMTLNQVIEDAHILIYKMDESQSYLTTAEHREYYDGLIKSYDLDKSLFSTYDKVYSLKRCQKDKDKDEDSFAGSNRGLKKKKTNKDAEPTEGLKAKESQSSSSKGAKSQSKSSRKSVQSEEPEFEVADSNMPRDQVENPSNDDEEPKGKVASKRVWFTKPKRPQEPTDPDWNDGKTPHSKLVNDSCIFC
uniref:Uncharacterized protein n=1 Tax=Tanacetum cinerariifolium TaxID=118510 RepID=A0A699GLL2_TANCI|nr:hypothetical protein [Tanacetum cinerariifolium]